MWNRVIINHHAFTRTPRTWIEVWAEPHTYMGMHHMFQPSFERIIVNGLDYFTPTTLFLIMKGIWKNVINLMSYYHKLNLLYVITTNQAQIKYKISVYTHTHSPHLEGFINSLLNINKNRYRRFKSRWKSKKYLVYWDMIIRQILPILGLV